MWTPSLVTGWRACPSLGCWEDCPGLGTGSAVPVSCCSGNPHCHGFLHHTWGRWGSPGSEGEQGGHEQEWAEKSRPYRAWTALGLGWEAPEWFPLPLPLAHPWAGVRSMKLGPRLPMVLGSRGLPGAGLMIASMKGHQGGHPSVCHTLSPCPCASPLLVGLGSLTRIWLCPPFARHKA